MSVSSCDKIQEVLGAYGFSDNLKGCERYGSGHINDTFLVVCGDSDSDRKYILQRMNHEVFKDPVGLMKNVDGVTRFMRAQIIRQGGDPDRETLNLVPTTAGQVYVKDSLDNYWRCYLFIGNATCYNLVEKQEDFYQSGKAFGHFQRMLADYPADQLSETIPGFHDTPKRFETFKQAVTADAMGRVASVTKEIQFVTEREADMHVAKDMLTVGTLPLRVTHNDTKLNNIMIDDTTGEALCIIDLDTIMPGLSIFDFGDSIRFGANTAEEDEQDLSKVTLSLPLFDVYTRGFLEGFGASLTGAEKQMLPMGAKLMTLECGMRFLTDYLQGDTYFKIHREGHNLDRTRTQFELVADMERKWKKMQEIVEKY